MMNKRTLLAAAALMAVTSCGEKKAEAPADTVRTLSPSEAAARDLKVVADAYLKAIVENNPFAVYFNLTDLMTPDHAGLPDISPEGDAAFEKREDALYVDLLKIDPESLKARGDWVTFETIKETMEANIGLRQCHQRWWSVSHMTGWQSFLSDFAAEQPTGTEEERAAALKRWSKIPAFIAQDRANLETGLTNGYSAPKSVVRRVIAQLDAVVAAPMDEDPYFIFAKKATEHPDFQGQVRALFEAEVIPAVAAYRDWLKDAYLPKAREAIAISALPGGKDCYEAMLRSYHSAKIGAQKTYDRGRETVESNKAAVIERGKAMFGESDFQKILARVKAVPENHFTSEKELIDFTRALVPETRDKAAPFFSKLPSQQLVVEPYADYLKGSGQPSRYEQRPEKEGPATYRIDTDNWATQTRGEAEIVAVHEGWPGHHLQISTARNLEGLHPITRLAGSTAYVEGWARYAEALAEEMGVYKDGYGEITRRAWPARGMVVDPGVHVFGWTNEQAIAFLKESGRQTDETARDVLDRIAVIPGQLTAYDTGGLEIFALRKEAQERLGDKFDIREFHDRILENSALPLGAMRTHVEKWIAEKEKAAPPE